MMRSLYSGVSGLKSHQTRMDVIGNNIANINTVGFKGSRTTFSDMLSQLRRNASGATTTRGGVNPSQVGLGVDVESIDLMFQDSSAQQTGKNTDLALSGNGLFVLAAGEQYYYTRNGAFSFDEQGYYVMPGNGLRVQGWNASSDGVLDTNGLSTDVFVPVGKTMDATETTQMTYNGNLDKEARIIERITYTAATGAEADPSKVTTNTISYNTRVSIESTDFQTVTGMINSDTEYAADATVNGITASVPVRGALDQTVTTGDPRYYYNVTYTDANGNVVGTARSTQSYTDAEAPTAAPTLTATATAASNRETTTTSVNVDGVNVIAARITFKDGTTMNVTDGYYQVNHSVPITTLATVYDSLGSKHEVTVLLEKDYTTADNNLTDENAIASAKILNPAGENVTNIAAVFEGEGPERHITRYTYSYDTRNDDGTIEHHDDGTATLDQVVFYNRWRVYIAPGVGEAGPAAGENFTNRYERSQDNGNPEADGSSTVGTMNRINYLYFDDRGGFISNGQDTDGSISFSYADGNGAANGQVIMDFSGLTQYASSTTSFPTTNGNTAGILQSLAVDASGIISGTYTNGLIRTEAQVAVAQFTNAAGLTKIGTTIYQESSNSGAANIRTVDILGLTITSSALEMSGVDLATEFADMIVTQRGFQANSKMTTVADEMLETVVNMKR